MQPRPDQRTSEVWSAEQPRLFLPLAILGIVIAAGTAGYILIERFPPLDALYMTVITISTVGYGEIRPLTPTGRVFTMVLIVLGVATTLSIFTELFVILYAGSIRRRLWRHVMQQKVDRLSGHFILCGFGRVGRQIADDLAQNGQSYVVVDRDGEVLQAAVDAGCLVVHGDASMDAVLRQAGVDRARGLITAVALDADNLMVTLSARTLNPQLLIVSRANTDEVMPKLERAGANRVVSPYHIGGRRMVMLALRPLAVEFVDSVFQGALGDLLLEDIEVASTSRLLGRSVEEVQTSLAPGVSILAIRRAATLLPRPSPDTTLLAGDELVAIGSASELRRLEELV